MRIAGIVLLPLALVWLGYALFALAWDGGTARATDDRIMAGLAIALAIGAAGMIARRSWGWMVCAAVAAVVVAGLVLASLARQAQRPAPAAGPALLQNLPQTEQPLAAALDRTWWAASVEALRDRERRNDAIARDWAIQGADRVRLLVLTDLRRGLPSETFFAYQAFLVLDTAKGTVVRRVFDDFSSDDRAAPVELRLSTEDSQRRATVLGRSSRGCLAKVFAIDAAAGTIAPLPTAGAC